MMVIGLFINSNTNAKAENIIKLDVLKTKVIQQLQSQNIRKNSNILGGIDSKYLNSFANIKNVTSIDKSNLNGELKTIWVGKDKSLEVLNNKKLF